MYKKWIVLLSFVLVGCNTATSQGFSNIPQDHIGMPTARPLYSPTSTALIKSIEPTSTSISHSIYINVNKGEGDVNIRSGVDISSSKLGVLKEGDLAYVIGQTQDSQWILIEFPSSPTGKGWVFSELVNVVGGKPPTVDPITNNVITPAPSDHDLKPVSLDAINAIKKFIGQESLDYKFLGEEENLNVPGQRVGRYRVGTTDYLIDLKSNLIVNIDNHSATTLSEKGKSYSLQELEALAKPVVTTLIPNINLNSYVYHIESKGEGDGIIYFFKWEDSNAGSPNNSFIYIAYNRQGTLIGYLNALKNK